MSKYINIFFVVIFVAFCFSCSDRTISEFQAPILQDQQTGSGNLDKSADYVPPFPNDNTDAQKDAFYNDNSSDNAHK